MNVPCRAMTEMRGSNNGVTPVFTTAFPDPPEQIGDFKNGPSLARCRPRNY